MNKAFVLMSQTHQPVQVFVIPDVHMATHYINQLERAAETVGRYGLLVDVQECGAPQASDVIRRLTPEGTPR